MTFFRWIKYSYAFECDVDRFTLLPVTREVLKLFNQKFFSVEISLYLYKFKVYAFFIF